MFVLWRSAHQQGLSAMHFCCAGMLAIKGKGEMECFFLDQDEDAFSECMSTPYMADWMAAGGDDDDNETLNEITVHPV